MFHIIVEKTGRKFLTITSLSVALCIGQPSFGQTTASQITPETLTPELRQLDGSIIFSGQPGTQAPPGAEAIGVTLAAVDLQGGLSEMASAHTTFVARLTRGRIPVSELFDATSELEAAYASEGYVLSRVVLPQQSLRDGGVLRVVVVNGFVEEIDTTSVPDQTRARIEGLTRPLIGRPGLTQDELERQLLLAGDTPGTALRTALGAGKEQGGALIVLEPEFRPITGFGGVGTPASDDLGKMKFDFGLEFNSPLRFGETIYLRVGGAPDEILTADPVSRILALGTVVPLGFSGLTLNGEITDARTTQTDALSPTRSSFSRKSLRLAYPFIRSRTVNLDGVLSLDHQTDAQDLIGGARIYEDRISVLRFGGTMNVIHEKQAVTSVGMTLSQGLNVFDARSKKDALSSGVPLSRSGADAVFTKLVGSISHQRSLNDALTLSVVGRFQSSFGEALVTSEQMTLVGPNELSSFNSGSLRGDSGWVVRSELSTRFSTDIGQIPVLFSPYAFWGFGSVLLENPTATERAHTQAKSYGIGVDIFAQTNSNFRSNSMRVEFGRGERNDGEPSENRFSFVSNFRF